MKLRFKSLAHVPIGQRVGKACGRWGQRAVNLVLDIIVPVPANVPIEAVRGVQRIIMVRPNFRIGNTLIATPLIVALRKRFPGAKLDYLCGDTTAPLLEHLPVDAVHAVSRRFVVQPWRFVAFFARLRRVHYDVAVDVGMGSFSGGLYAYLAGARYRVGCGGKANHFLNVRLPEVHTSHAYDAPEALAALLGVSCADHPIYTVSAEEQAAGLRVLSRLGVTADGTALPFVGVFVGGHLAKRWPTARWIEFTQSLATLGGPIIVFLGPEEMPFERRYRRMLPPSVSVLSPQPLRLFAALWGAAHLVVTPDSGPMHLAAALGVPAIAILQSEASRKYAPRTERDRILVRPTVAEALAAVVAHPAWAQLASPAPKPGPNDVCHPRRTCR